jgi:hypothetical protein
VERVSGSFQPPPAQPVALPAAPSPELATRLEQLASLARAANDRFESREAKARQTAAAAAGAQVASENWAKATVAIADLESARSEAMIALADLDAMYASARLEGRDVTAIAQTRDAVTALVAKQDAVLAQLRDMVPA